MASFLDVTGINPCPDLSPNQNALRIASGTETTLIRKEDTTPLTVVQFLCSLHHCKRWRWWSTFNGRQRSGRWDDISVIPCSCRLRAATTNLSNNCTCGLERFPSARSDTFVDSELCSYIGDGTLLLQLSDHSSTCEVVQVISSSRISRTDLLALAANMLNCVSVLHFILLLSSERRYHAFCVGSRRF
ncbi:hypothetical protein TNCV_2130191 [Trichonephila clavipes]|nr:hypothetical protein TNCV_2130191 [Trichonephila clavipes]